MWLAAAALCPGHVSATTATPPPTAPPTPTCTPAPCAPRTCPPDARMVCSQCGCDCTCEPLVSPTPTTTVAACEGDCDGDRRVTVDELIRGVAMALGASGADACAGYADCAAPGCPTVDRLVAAVRRALLGCHGAAARFAIRGCVQHFSGCGGLEFGTVRLEPLGRTAPVDAGYFLFADVPPGEYRLSYDPACNPAGCTSVVTVVITDGDGYAPFLRSPVAR